jgi:uncharacterized membrane protein YraQ (UPF0718 family)
VNVLAIILTARVLGAEIGVARAVGSVVFAILIGSIMATLFRRGEEAREESLELSPEASEAGRPLRGSLVLLALLLGVLVFAAWGKPKEATGWSETVHGLKWPLAGAFALLAVLASFRWFDAAAREAWLLETWGLAKLILPLLFAGVLVAGFLLGRPQGDGGLIPAGWVAGLVGDNSPGANLIAAASGALMYFATLTEVPILQGLLGQGVHEGPALSLLLAGPAVSLPNLLVIRGVLGTRKALVYAGLVVLLSATAGLIFGSMRP